MSDFDENWQLKGSSDPATPDIQPNQIQAQQPVVSPYQPAPVMQPQQAPLMQQPVMQPQAAPVAPAGQVPVQPQTAPQGMPVQPMTQQAPVMQQPQMVQSQMTQPVYQAPVQQIAPGYGYAAAQPMMYNPVFVQEREKSLTELNTILNHFAPKVDVYQKYEAVNANIRTYSKTSIAPLIWGIIVSLFGLFQLANAIFWVKYADNKVIYYVLGGIGLLAGAGLITLYVLKKTGHKKKKEKFIEEAGELSHQLTLLYNGCGNCPVAPEYTDPRILYKLQAIIMSGRCATIPDVMNTLLMIQRNFQRIETEKAQFAAETAERYDGKPAFFNAVRFFNLM